VSSGERRDGARAVDLAGRVVLVTAGPTREPIDPVRYLSNRSSGKMGFALAAAAAERGAVVTLVAGPVALPPPPGVTLVRVERALAMLEAVVARAAASDVLVMAAAVADYRVADPAERKIKRGAADLLLRLVPNPDILATVGAARVPGRPPHVVVGFALETDALLDHARDKLRRKGCDLLVANLASESLGLDASVAVVIDAGGVVDEPGRVPKGDLAHRILDQVVRRLPPREAR
jgi:phosphopantothenoylcysteine decarboxylase/phosphopantothenate--cysteine ligase